MTPRFLPRAITPPGSIATRARRRDVGQSLSNVVFQGTVLRVREVPGEAATRYVYDCRIRIGRSEATRVTIRGAVASESQPGGFEASTGEFHPGDQVAVYRVSRSEWVITGREPQNKENVETSLALETDRATLAMDPTGYIVSSSSERAAHSISGGGVGMALASGFYPPGGIRAAMMRLSGNGAVLDHVTGESGRLSWIDGVLSLSTSGPNHLKDRLSIPVLVESSDPKPQIRKYFADAANSPATAGTTDAPGMTGKTDEANAEAAGTRLSIGGNTALDVPNGHDHGFGSLTVEPHTHEVGELSVVIDINGFLGRLAAVALSNHMVTDQAHLDPMPTAIPPVELKSPGGARWLFAGREGRLSGTGPRVVALVVALLGGTLSRGNSVLNATQGMVVRNFQDGVQGVIPNQEPGTHFPDLSDPERRRRMAEIGALRVQGGHVVYNDNIVLSAKGWSSQGFIEGEESAPVFAPNLPALTIDDASDGTQRALSDADVAYKVLGVAALPAPDAEENEIIAPGEEPVYRYVWSARLKPKLSFAR